MDQQLQCMGAACRPSGTSTKASATFRSSLATLRRCAGF